MNKDKIAILTTVANFNLYKKTAHFFPKEIRKFVFDGRNGMYGIDSLCFAFKKLKNLNIDWLILADEDVIFENPEVVFDIIELMEQQNYSVSGVRDGGVISHREFNPNVVNTFFCILNFKKILEIWNKDEMLKNQYVIKDEFDKELLNLNYKYNTLSLYEPYYCFYLWLLRNNYKTLYLDSLMLKDGITNQIYFKNKPIATHTWYARSYGNNKKHTERIDFFLNNLNLEIQSKINFILIKNKLFKIKKVIKTIIKKVKIN